MSLELLRKDLRKAASPERAKASQRYFKTGKGEYGEGDIFLGLTNLQMRLIAKKYKDAPLVDLQRLLDSQYHEERQVALFILVDKYKRASLEEKNKIFDFYLANTQHINNWDLVDLSAHHIIGAHLKDKNKSVLYKLAKSSNLWERRIAIISTFYFIRDGDFTESLKIAEILLHDKHDLIHKAVGWMLREIGKRDLKVEETFLKKYYEIMPRTMLRYAIEKFPEKKRKMYLGGEI